MNPMNVDLLFAQSPELFAYQLPSAAERAQLKPGDLVKLFFKLERFNHPRPIWFTVTDVGGSEPIGASGVLSNMSYGEWAKSAFPGPVEFGVENIYRLPLDRPEIENPKFDDSTRT